MGRVIPDYFSTKKYIYTYENLRKKKDRTISWGRTSFELQANLLDHHFQRTTVQVTMYDSLTMTRIKHWNVARQNSLFLLQNLLIASKLPNNSVSGCCCTLLAGINVLRYLDVSSNESSPLLQLRNLLSPFLRLRLRLLDSFKGALLPNLNKMVERELLITGVQKHENILQITRTILRVGLRTLRLEANNV